MEYVESGLAEGARATTAGARRPWVAASKAGTSWSPRFSPTSPPTCGSPGRRSSAGDLSCDTTGSRGGRRAGEQHGFGLGGLVFGADPDAALAVAERMDTGSVGINFFASNHAAPFGGRHDSGLGVEYGIEGLDAYLSYKSIHRRTG